MNCNTLAIRSVTLGVRTFLQQPGTPESDVS